MPTLIARNLDVLMRRENTNPTKLEKETKVPQPTIHRILSGESKDPRTGTLQPLADYFGVSVSDLRVVDLSASGTGEPRQTGATISIKTDEMPDHIHAIPLLNAHGSMGGGAYPDATEYTIAEIDVTETWLRQTLPTISAPANLRLMTGLGDSMTPTYRNGDTLFVDTGVKTIDIDGVFVFEFKDVVYVKRVQRVPDGLKIISDNKQYDPFTIEREKYPEIMVYGRVHGALEYKGF